MPCAYAEVIGHAEPHPNISRSMLCVHKWMLTSSEVAITKLTPDRMIYVSGRAREESAWPWLLTHPRARATARAEGFGNLEIVGEKKK